MPSFGAVVLKLAIFFFFFLPRLPRHTMNRMYLHGKASWPTHEDPCSGLTGPFHMDGTTAGQEVLHSDLPFQ